MNDGDYGRRNWVRAGQKYVADTYINERDSMFKPVLTLIFALIFLGCFLPQVHAESRLVNIRQIDYGAYPCNSEFPGLSASGQQVGFESDCDWAGSNPSRNNEIFVMEIDGSNPVQVTTGNAFSCNVALNASGKRLAFISFADLIPGQNADRNSDIFRVYADGAGLRQLTRTVGGVDVGGGYLAHCCPAVDYSGRTIVFLSPFDPTNGNADLGHDELWIVNWDGSDLRRLTNTPFGGSSGYPVFDGVGRVYFPSNANWTGENPDGRWEVFRIDPRKGKVEQLSQFASVNGSFVHGRMGVDASGLKVILPVTTGDDMHMDLFMLDTKSREIAQLTETEGGRGCFTASMSASGRRIAYTCEVPGQPPGAAYSKVFIADVVYRPKPACLDP